MLIIKQVCKKKGIKLYELAEQLGITYGALHKSIKEESLTFNRLVEIARILTVDVHELVQCSNGFKHIYDNENIWYGITQKLKE